MKRPSRLLVLSLALLVVALASAVVTMHFAIRSAETNVPELKGLTVAEALRRAAAAGFAARVDRQAYNSSAPGGHVLTQSPPAGALVSRESEIRLIESLGAHRVAVPDTVGKDEQAAVLQLRQAGVAVHHVARLPDSWRPAGTVLAQSPGGIDVGDPSVSLLVSERQDATQAAFVMPDFTGEAIAEARLAIRAAGFRDVKVVRASLVSASRGGQKASGANRSGSVPQHPVVSQSPAPGTRIALTDPIELTVAP